MIYYLYKVTNLINNKIYIGVHQTKNTNDNYMGSGKIIKQAISKYGIDNFEKEIIKTFECYDSMMEEEQKIVSDDFISLENVYNLKRGGSGGFHYINKNRLNQTPAAIEKRKLTLKETSSKVDKSGTNASFYGKYHSEETKQLLSDIKKQFYENGGDHPKGMLGKHHSEDTKQRVSSIMKEKGSLLGKKGIDHPAGGTTWYNNGHIHLRSCDHPGDGWIEGRIFKKRQLKNR